MFTVKSFGKKNGQKTGSHVNVACKVAFWCQMNTDGPELCSLPRVWARLQGEPPLVQTLSSTWMCPWQRFQQTLD